MYQFISSATPPPQVNFSLIYFPNNNFIYYLKQNYITYSTITIYTRSKNVFTRKNVYNFCQKSKNIFCAQQPQESWTVDPVKILKTPMAFSAYLKKNQSILDNNF